MAGTLVLAVVVFLGVSFFLWRYETSGDICFDEGQILEKWIALGYDPFVYSPLIHYPPLKVRERFLLKVGFEELGAINIEVGRQIFEEAEKGKLVVVMYQMGRVTGQLRSIDLC